MLELLSKYVRVILLFLLNSCMINICFGQTLSFTEISQSIGINFKHDYQIEIEPVNLRVTAGLAVGDYNNDGFPDIYVEAGDIGNNLLFKNRGDGTFVEKGEEAGVHLPNFLGSSPFFVDYDNDGFQDLMVGSLDSQNVRIFKNIDGQTFEEVTNDGLNCAAPTYSFSAGDFNKDGFVDLFLTHWKEDNSENHIYKNQRDGTFKNVDADVDFYNPFGDIDFTFAGNFTDFNNDGWTDLLIASDFGTSQIWVNNNGKAFDHFTDTQIINDENGMGTAIGDYNNDGLLDWFVSSIFDSDGVTEGNWGASGNRLYKNLGNNQFQNVSEESGILDGAWGWGSSFADLNNDGYLDIVQTNGWPKGSDQFYADTTRIFLSNQDGTFTESAIDCGLRDTKQGRGISVLDYDLDGDLDIFINNYRDYPSFWRNDLNNNNQFISIKLIPHEGVTAIGSKVLVYTQGVQQIRELRCGTNYNGQNPLQIHFGLGAVSQIDSLIVKWPNGEIQKQFNLLTNQFLEISQDFKFLPTNEAFFVYPNPFDDNLTTQFQGDSENKYRLRLWDSSGKLIGENDNYSIMDNSCYFEWNLNGTSRIPAGCYFIQLYENNQVVESKKIIKY